MKRFTTIMMVVMVMAMAGCGATNTTEKKETTRKSIAWIGYGDRWDYGDGIHTAINITEIGVYIDTDTTHETVYKTAEEICRENEFWGLFILENTDRIYGMKQAGSDPFFLYYDFYVPTNDSIFEGA